MANNQIALLAQVPEFDTPLESQAKAMKIRDMMNQSQVQDMEMAQRRQDIADAAVVRDAYAANPTDTKARLQALSRAPKAYQAERKALQDAEKVTADIGKTQAETRKVEIESAIKTIDSAGQALGYVMANPTLENAISTLDFLERNGIYPAADVAHYKDLVTKDPTQIKGLAEQSFRAALDAKEQLAKIDTRNLGNRMETRSIDPVTGKATLTDTQAIAQSPDSVASNETQRRGQNMVDARAKAAAAATAGGDGLLPQETVAMMAQQYLAGDTSVMQNLGRGAQGAQNIIKLRNEIARQTTEQGKGGADLAAQNAEYFGTKAGQRSAGTRIANVEMAVYEAKNLMPMAREASAAVSRSGLLPFGKAQVMFNEQTNDPAMRQFAAANNALVNVYSRAISPTGVPTVHDKEHAREMISTAISHDAYLAVVDQMERELTAAQAAPQQVRQAFNDAVTKRGGHGSPAATAAKSAPAIGTVEGGYKFKGGNPSDKANWVKQ